MSEPGKEDQCSSGSDDGGAQSTVKQRIHYVSRETQKSGEIHLGEYSKQTDQCKISYCVHKVKVNMKSERTLFTQRNIPGSILFTFMNLVPMLTNSQIAMLLFECNVNNQILFLCGLTLRLRR